MKLNRLNKNQYNILVELRNEYYYKGYDWFEGERKELQKEIKTLKNLGYVEYHRGLMTEDGKTAGSGFCRNMDKDDEIDELVESYEVSNLKI